VFNVSLLKCMYGRYYTAVDLDGWTINDGILLEAFLPAFRTRMSGYHPVVLVPPRTCHLRLPAPHNVGGYVEVELACHGPRAVSRYACVS